MSKKTIKNIFYFISLIFLSNFCYGRENTTWPPHYDALRSLYENLDGINWQRKWDYSNSTSDPCLDRWPGIIGCLNVKYNSIGYNVITMIDLAANGLNGLLPNGFFANLSTYPSLGYFDIAKNNVGGPFPNLVKFSSLKYFDILDNMFTGTMPDLIGIKNTALVYLNVDKNLLRGTIPASIGNLKNLQYLILSRNKFNGSIPDLGNCTNLDQLHLSFNPFSSGQIPQWMSSLNKITVIRLSDTGLTGSIPDFFGNLKNLTFLALTVNKLTGPISQSLAGSPIYIRGEKMFFIPFN